MTLSISFASNDLQLVSLWSLQASLSIPTRRRYFSENVLRVKGFRSKQKNMNRSETDPDEGLKMIQGSVGVFERNRAVFSPSAWGFKRPHSGLRLRWFWVRVRVNSWLWIDSLWEVNRTWHVIWIAVMLTWAKGQSCRTKTIRVLEISNNDEERSWDEKINTTHGISSLAPRIVVISTQTCERFKQLLWLRFWAKHLMRAFSNLKDVLYIFKNPIFHMWPVNTNWTWTSLRSAVSRSDGELGQRIDRGCEDERFRHWQWWMLTWRSC